MDSLARVTLARAEAILAELAAGDVPPHVLHDVEAHHRRAAELAWTRSRIDDVARMIGSLLWLERHCPQCGEAFACDCARRARRVAR